MPCRGKSWCTCRGCKDVQMYIPANVRAERLIHMRTIMRDPRERYRRIKYLKSQNRGLTTWPKPGTMGLQNGKGGEGGRHATARSASFDRTQELIGQMMTTKTKSHSPACLSGNPFPLCRRCSIEGKRSIRPAGGQEAFKTPSLGI